MSKATFGRRLIDGFTMFIVTALSLLLLLYVSYGDSKRNYEQIHIEKLLANASVVQVSIEKFLRDGLPLKQYAGFNTLAGPMLEGEDLDAMVVYDQMGRQVFISLDKAISVAPEPPDVIKTIKQTPEVHYSATHYQLVIPLRTRFETVGSLVLSSSNEVVGIRLRNEFRPLLYGAMGLSVIFAMILMVVLPKLAGSRIPWLQIGYGLTFSIMSAAVISTLIGLYYDGVQGKSKATAVTLSQRLNDIVTFKLQFKDIDGIGRTFSEYRKVNAEVNEAALIENGIVALGTEAGRVGKNWTSDKSNFEYRIDLSQADPQRRADLTVTVPRNVVYERVIRSVKNFAALFVASAFLAGLFLQVAASLQGLRSRQSSPDGPSAAALGDAALIIVKPVFFLAVFLDALTYSFLPKYMQEAAVAAGMSVSYASVPFTAYYLTFALSLLPAGSLAERHGPKPLIVVGMLIAAAAVAGMFLPLSIYELTALRGLAGIGQGVLIIGVQTYILAVAPPEKKTQGAAIIVFGFQGGLISGMALGSLLVNSLMPSGVFAISGAVGVLATIFTLVLLPRAEKKAQAKGGLGAAILKLVSDIKNVSLNLEFLKVLFCVGMPAKAILTGAMTFALPLLLGHYGYRSEDIGQIIMLYGLGVIIASGYASRLVDRTKKTEAVLFAGSVFSGLGLLLIGALGSSFVGTGPLGTVLVIGGTVVVGLAHGFINAPVVTHMSTVALAKRIGANPVTTAYRFLERGGHVAGPLIASQLFLIWGQEAFVMAGIGLAVLLLGVLFVVRLPGARVAAPAPETPR